MKARNSSASVDLRSGGRYDASDSADSPFDASASATAAGWDAVFAVANLAALVQPAEAAQASASRAPAGASDARSFATAAAVAVSPTLATEVSFINALNPNGTLVTSTGKSYWTHEGVTARKWGAATAGTSGGTVTYAFDTASKFTAQEEATIEESFALWSAVANITFVQASGAQSSANVLLHRGAKGSGEYFDDQGNATNGSGSTLGSYDGQTLINIDTSTYGFDLSGSFSQVGGYGLASIIHEMGHLVGLGHGGAYNGTVNPKTQQYSAYDTGLYSIMSYIEPYDTTAKYYSTYPVMGTNWGNASDGSGAIETSTTMMPLDILAVQQLYGAPVGGPLSGNDTFGFHCNISGVIEPFFDFTKNTQPVITLYDSGTGNTLDVSGFKQGSTIDLAAGTFSSCDGLTNNLGIAFGTAIDSVVCGAGNDTIISNADVDTLTGGAGNDTYYINNSKDKVVELNGGGTDSVFASVSYSLVGSFVETLTLDGSTAASATGNGFANTIVGNAYGDTITGGGGNDTLTGGAGADTFVYHAKFGLDTITNFTAATTAHDTIQIDKTLFADYATLMAHTVDSGANAIITYDAKDAITLDAVHTASLVATDFKFV